MKGEKLWQRTISESIGESAASLDDAIELIGGVPQSLLRLARRIVFCVEWLELSTSYAGFTVL